MEDILIRGSFRGFTRHRLITLGTVGIEWLYPSLAASTRPWAIPTAACAGLMHH